MLEFTLCSMLTILPDYLIRRYVQGKRIGHEITLFSVWYELRWGITLCAILTISLITVIFYFHPATKQSTLIFRTLSVIPETAGRVDEVNVANGQRVAEGDVLFTMDNARQTSAVAAAEQKVLEIDAQVSLAEANLATAEAQIAQIEAQLEEAERELARTQELTDRGSSAVSQRDLDRQTARVQSQEAALEAAISNRAGAAANLDVVLPAQRASAAAALEQAQVELDKTIITAGVDGVLEQFGLASGDYLAMLRPAGIIIPDDVAEGRLHAGFDQVNAKVIKPGMLGEVACVSNPYEIIPVIVVDVQDVIAAGQLRPTDQLIDLTDRARPGSLTVIVEALYPGGLDGLIRGSKCITNLYTNNHDKVASGEVTGARAVALHAVDAMGVVHAIILRFQALMLPVQNLVLTGH
ncbi:MAG: biotin/lipoyl-binding protein [Marinibacterium sp.]|nr:biotin/lipoyl-binding protein [Marinibacterium sp.]